MGREKRKGRLNKGEATEFIGFGAFGDAPSPGSPLLPSSGRIPTGTPQGTTSQSLSLAPVYVGSDSQLSVLFPRIGQKRDATTKTKALSELRDFFASSTTLKKSQVEALAHFLYIYQSKLHYDNTPRVRSGSLECCHQAVLQIPRAFSTFCTQQPELIGMMLCGRADPATDVARAANQLAITLSTLENSESLINLGLWAYVERILSYTKPMQMHEDLFQKKSESTLSDKQEDELDERYVRIVGTAITGLQIHVPSQKGNHLPTSDDTKYIWKTLTSQKAALRRKTYDLLSTCCRQAPSLVDQSKMSNILLQNLSSEKEPTNVKLLLETLLAFVASVPPAERTSLLAQYSKALTKLFSKGCHGATQWAPTVLPIVSLLPADDQANVLTSIWQGKTHLVGATDQLEVVSAVAETSAFLLLRRSHDLAEVIAQCWLRALQVYATHSIGNSDTGPLAKAYDALGRILAKDLQAMDLATSTKTDSAMILLEDAFWNIEIPKVLVLDPGVDVRQMAALVGQFPMESNGPQLVQVFKRLFRHNLETCSGLVPTEDLYNFWILLLHRIPIDQVFDASEREHFLMNDLLRWMVIHTSSLSDQFDLSLCRRDFELYDKSKTSTSWEPTLRELVAAKCDLEALASGLVVLSQSAGVDYVKSSILDDLCKQVAKESIVELHFEEHEDSEDEYTDATELNRHYHRKAADLLQTCVGLGEMDSVIVDEAVVLSWVEIACPMEPLTKRSSNPVLETLVALIKNDYFKDSHPVERILLQVWRQGGELWVETIVPWITRNTTICHRILTCASSEMKLTLASSTSEPDVDEYTSRDWAERAVRLFQICANGTVASELIPLPSIDLLGLDNLSIWDCKPSASNTFAALGLMHIMELLDEYDGNAHEYRLGLCTNVTTTNPTELLIQILLHLSSGSSDLLHSIKCRSRMDDSYILLSRFGGRAISTHILEALFKACVSRLLDTSLNGEKGIIFRCVAVLSQLVTLGFAAVKPAAPSKEKDMLEAYQIGEGDSLWYIVNASNPALREPCTVVKVHNDPPSEVYFTIRVDREGKTHERQTVSERLRSSADSDSNSDASVDIVAVNKIQPEESRRRQKLLGLIMDSFIQKSWNHWGQAEFETLNILISQLGLLGARGIGSLHYVVFQKLLAYQANVVDLLDGVVGDKAFPTVPIWSLALALGYGMNSPSSDWNNELTGFDPEDTVYSLLFLFNGDAESESDDDKSDDGGEAVKKAIPQVRLASPSLRSMRAAIALLTVALPALQDDHTREDARSLLFRFVGTCLRDSKSYNFSEDDYMALRALSSVPEENQANTETDAVVQLVGSFALRWESAADAQWVTLPLAHAVLETILTKRSRIAGIAARKYADSLTTGLNSDRKRWYALRFLDAYAHLAKPIFDSPENTMNDETSNRVKLWSAGLADEEIEELQEDCQAVCQWIPRQLMNEVESWRDVSTGHFVLGEDDAYSRMTSWIAYVRIASVAGSMDSLYRTGLNTYTRKSGAVDYILDLAMSYANVSTDRKVRFAEVDNIDNLFSTNNNVELSKLAWAILFRTVEVFPTLAKNWWETNCPNYFREPMREFVEAHVAPELLRRELQRMKAASSFGEMTVKGSLVSREVIALYKQDEFTLSVVIRLPSCFPFRRAEVDCSKTLGVPESRWKRWALQITQMLNNQGGSLTDALVLWKDNVEKEFEGIEPCPVCYSVLHVKTHKLPEMECKTCHNRFHFDCLTQWFRSSGKSACVICQQPWSGTRV